MWNWLISLEDCKASTSLVDALLADITKRIDEFLKIQKGDASAGPGKTDGRKLTRWEGDEFEKVVEVADFVRDKLFIGITTRCKNAYPIFIGLLHIVREDGRQE